MIRVYVGSCGDKVVESQYFARWFCVSNDVVIYQSDDGLVKMEAIVDASNGPEYLFYGSNCINYYRDMHENVISSYYKNIPDIKTCHDSIGDRIWKREINVTEVKNANEFRSQGNGMKK